MNEDIIYKPRSGEEMTRATLHAPIYTYSELCQQVKKLGVRKVLSHMFKVSPSSVILLQNPEDMSSGHWMSLTINPARHDIYFFSTYGGKPDVEKDEWLSKGEQQQSGQERDFLREGLQQMQKYGWTIHYNDHPYQKPGDKTATCGIYTAAFIRSGMNPEEFYRFHKLYHLTPRDYYRAYFK